MFMVYMRVGLMENTREMNGGDEDTNDGQGCLANNSI